MATLKYDTDASLVKNKKGMYCTRKICLTVCDMRCMLLTMYIQISTAVKKQQNNSYLTFVCNELWLFFSPGLKKDQNRPNTFSLTLDHFLSWSLLFFYYYYATLSDQSRNTWHSMICGFGWRWGEPWLSLEDIWANLSYCFTTKTHSECPRTICGLSMSHESWLSPNL